MGSYESVRISIEEQVAILTIDRPPVNALNRQTLMEMEAAIEEISADANVRVIILTGAGQIFVAGADIRELDAADSYEKAFQITRSGQRLLNKIEACKKPVIAAINGRFALGGGSELAMACHMRIAEEGVRFGQPEIGLGVMPGWGGTQRLPRLIGSAKALELLLTSAQLTAAEACQLGLVNKVVPAGTALQEAKQIAKTITQFSARSVTSILSAVQIGLRRSLEEGLDYEAEQFALIFQTEDKKEGIKAFLEKRRPQFKHR
jgi:enoyl-CoA hydratase/carnithine racemase